VRKDVDLHRTAKREALRLVLAQYEKARPLAGGAAASTRFEKLGKKTGAMGKSVGETAPDKKRFSWWRRSMEDGTPPPHPRPEPRNITDLARQFTCGLYADSATPPLLRGKIDEAYAKDPQGRESGDSKNNGEQGLRALGRAARFRLLCLRRKRAFRRPFPTDRDN